jgi:TATA-binding protein-associated factor Taf7
MLYYLIYTSKSSALVDDKELLKILDESRNWNQDHGLTGMLLYINGGKFHQKEGRFMQVLEGTAEEVNGIFEKIKKDKRHHSITLLDQSEISERNFESWTMGFQDLDWDAYNQSNGSFELDESLLDTLELKKFSIAVMYLKSFYNMG